MHEECTDLEIIPSLLIVLLIFLTVLIASDIVQAQEQQTGVDPKTIPCCDYNRYQSVVWSGVDPKMTVQELAAYCAPVLWFSPDEPLLNGDKGKDLKLPEPLPFEENPGSAVVYYQVLNILSATDAAKPAYIPDEKDINNSIIDLSQTAGIDIEYYFYYHAEVGVGSHKHDIESAEFQIVIWNREDRCETCKYSLVITKTIARAHGVSWYDNTLVTDEYAKFPMHLLVEEGKHASCTDKNADGHFTPSYDVNRRVNDAWGVRDVISSGTLLSGSFQAWMAKPRHPEHRVFPPLPQDSPLRGRFIDERGIYAPHNAIYLIRPLPPARLAGSDIALKQFLAPKVKPDGPDVEPNTDLEIFSRWINDEPFIKTVSINLYADGERIGVSTAFPFFLVKNLVDPMAGGFITHRVYLKDRNLRDLGWLIHYTPSASRWFDKYISVGVEWDKINLPKGSEKKTKTVTDFVVESGFKFRANISHTPFKSLTRLTDFWGVRVGVKNKGSFDINRFTYVLEIGAGAW